MNGVEIGKPLHDATLVSLTVDWPSGEVRLLFRASRGSIELRCAGVTNVICPRAEPWGRSASVNDATVTRVERSDIQIVKIEMQTGDTIVVEAKMVSVLGPGDRSTPASS